MEKNKYKKPTEIVELPSKGLLYPKDNILSNGTIDVYYMTAAHEDILTNKNYIKQEIVIDKLLQSLIASPINYDDLLIGDKNAILVAVRILGYGPTYSFEFTNPITNNKEDVKINLGTLKEKHPDPSTFTPGVNEFNFRLPSNDVPITFKALTQKDERLIDEELKGLKKINPNGSFEITTRLKYMITSVNGKREVKDIREFVDNNLLARDSRALRTYYSSIVPDVQMTFDYDKDGYTEEGIVIPMTTDFFWPEF